MPVMGARAAGDLREKFHLPCCWLRVLDYVVFRSAWPCSILVAWRVWYLVSVRVAWCQWPRRVNVRTCLISVTVKGVRDQGWWSTYTLRCLYLHVLHTRILSWYWYRKRKEKSDVQRIKINIVGSLSWMITQLIAWRENSNVLSLQTLDFLSPPQSRFDQVPTKT